MAKKKNQQKKKKDLQKKEQGQTNNNNSSPIALRVSTRIRTRTMKDHYYDGLKDLDENKEIPSTSVENSVLDQQEDADTTIKTHEATPSVVTILTPRRRSLPALPAEIMVEDNIGVCVINKTQKDVKEDQIEREHMDSTEEESHSSNPDDNQESESNPENTVAEEDDEFTTSGTSAEPVCLG